MRAYKLVKRIIKGLITLEDDVKYFYLVAASKDRPYIVQKVIPVKKDGLSYVQADPVELELIYGDTFIIEVQTVTSNGQKSPFKSVTQRIDDSVPAPVAINLSSSVNKIYASIEDDLNTAFYEWIVKPRDFKKSYSIYSYTSNTVTLTELNVYENELAGRKVYLKGTEVYYKVIENSDSSSGYTEITLERDFATPPTETDLLMIAVEVDFSNASPTHRTSTNNPLEIISNADEELFFWVRRVNSFGGTSAWFPASPVGKESVNCSRGIVKPTMTDFLNPSGIYKNNMPYYYYPGSRRDVVKYNDFYYYMKVEGGVVGIAPSGVNADNDTWGYMESFRSIATELALIEDGLIISSLTMGDATHDGIIQSYGWNGTNPGYRIKGGQNPEILIVAGEFTGGVFQTSKTGRRVKINGTANSIDFYGDDTHWCSLMGDVAIYDWGTFSVIGTDSDAFILGNLYIFSSPYPYLQFAGIGHNQYMLGLDPSLSDGIFRIDLNDDPFHTGMKIQAGAIDFYSDYTTVTLKLNGKKVLIENDVNATLTLLDMNGNNEKLVTITGGQITSIV